MPTKILVCGLPGSGKTTLAVKIVNKLLATGATVLHLNADEVRTKFSDWDFSLSGRIRQAQRMLDLASRANTDFVVADFIAPLESMRKIFAADYTIVMETIATSRFENTNAIFETPCIADVRISEFNFDEWTSVICAEVQVISKSINTI